MRDITKHRPLHARIFRALQGTQSELLNNTSKLTEINRRIKRDAKKLEEVKNDPPFSDEQRQLYRDRLDDLNTEKKGKARNTVTKSKRSSNAGRKDQANDWKSS